MKYKIPEKIKEINIELEKLDRETKTYEKFNEINKTFKEVEKLCPEAKILKINKLKFNTYIILRRYCKKMVSIINISKELQENDDENYFAAKNGNIIITTNGYGTKIQFPLIIEIPQKKGIEIYLFKKPYVDRIKECIEAHKKLVVPHTEKINMFLEQVKIENSKYFVLNKL